MVRRRTPQILFALIAQTARRRLVSYTVWMYGRLIGEAMLEVGSTPARRVGAFHPTIFGLSVLPGITDMFPALVAFGEFCRRRKLAGCEPDRAADETLGAFASTPEGQRVIAAAKQVDQLVVRDAGGRIVAWQSIAITDVEQFTALATAGTSSCPSEPPHGDATAAGSPRFRMSLTLARERARGGAWGRTSAALGGRQPALES